jgi:hypothetical protein
MMGLSDELRKSIEASGLTLYRIAKDSGVSYPSVHYFLTGDQGLTLESAEKLFDYLGWTLKPPKPKRGSKRTRPPRKRQSRK